MKMPYSKKEMLKDIIKMRGIIENIEASNTELALMNDINTTLIEETNNKINTFNSIVSLTYCNCVKCVNYECKKHVTKMPYRARIIVEEYKNCKERKILSDNN